jgi:hypothetical protein
VISKEDLIAYARRDWAAFERMKRERWAEQREQMTAADVLRMGDALREWVQTIHPDWPTDEDRKKDIATHIRVAEMLRRVQPPGSR